MPNIGDAERATQNRVVKFFREKLHYTYLGDLHDVDDNSNIIEDKLKANLIKRGYSSTLADKAIAVLKEKSVDLSQDLYKANQDVYSLLKYGAKVSETHDDAPRTVYFIDFTDATKNAFYIAVCLCRWKNNGILLILRTQLRMRFILPKR